MIIFEGLERDPIYWCLVGSHNYNLNTEESDKDYKVFVAPTFKDLYDGDQYTRSYVGSDLDYTVHDIRKLPRLLWKANINFIEVLFSEESSFSELEGVIGQIIAGILIRNNGLARMNLPYLYDACIGMYYTKYNQLMKGTEGTKHLVAQYGYDTKQALHCYRVLDFLERYYIRDFQDFKGAVWYEDGARREFMLNIKQGGLTLKEFELLLHSKRTDIDRLEGSYKKQIPDETLCKWLENQIEALVKYIITGLRDFK